MQYSKVAAFAKGQNISQLLVMLTENAIQYKIEDSEEAQTLWVEEDKAEQVARFLANLQAGKGPDGSLNSGQNPLLRAIKAWPATFAMIALGLLGYLLVRFDQSMSLVGALTYIRYETLGQHIVPLSLYESVFASGQIWRTITPAFLHFGFAHILFNGLAMWELGRRLETVLGLRIYLLSFVIIVQLSNFAQYVASGPVVFGGLSGAVFGFIAMIAVLSARTKHPLLALPKGLYALVIITVVLGVSGLIDKVFGINLANSAHIGGLVCGAVLGLILSHKKTLKSY